MSTRAKYQPGPAAGAHVQKDGGTWTLVIVRELRHAPAKVWRALTDPAELREWAPFDPDRNLSTTGPATLATVGTPPEYNKAGSVQRAEEARVLEFDWSGNSMRWELEPTPNGTRLTLWHNIPRGYIAMGAAGWHICLDVLDLFLTGQPIGRIVAGDALQFDGWHRLNAEYSSQFGVAVMNPNSPT
jgi:uncharacterized protein YndB with AHSA1/START domain